MSTQITSVQNGFGEKYTVLSNKTIGRGNFAFVCIGMDKRSGSPVAVKVFKDIDEQKHEANILNMMVGKSHLARMRDYGSLNSCSCIALDLISNGDTSRNLKEMGRDLLPEQIRSCGAQLLECLSSLKPLNLVHADIKPNNVMYVPKKNHLTLIDFASSQKLEDLKKLGLVTTICYCPPEVFLGYETLDMSYDMWSFGCTLFELYTGRLMFPWENDDFNPLKYILATIGLPSKEYQARCKNFSVTIPPERFKRDWRRYITESVKDARHALLVIDLLEKIFVYENRLSVEEARRHPLFTNDIQIELDCKDIPPFIQKERFLSVSGLTIPLSQRCIHLPKNQAGLYTFQVVDIVDRVSYEFFRKHLSSGYKLEISANDIALDIPPIPFECIINQRQLFEKGLICDKYLFLDETSQLPLVIKVPCSKTRSSYADFINEASSLRKVKGDLRFTQIRFLGQVELEGVLVPAMGFDRLLTVKEVLCQRGVSAFSLSEIICLARAMVTGFGHLQEKGVVGLDLSSSNLMLVGESKQLQIAGVGCHQLATQYCSPERLVSKEAAGKADFIWAFGVIFFELYTGGSFPFPWDAQDLNSPLKYILSSFGYISSADHSFEGLEKLISAQHRLDWRKGIEFAGKIRRHEESVLVIDLLEQIFKYRENRLTLEGALAHPLFAMREDQ